MGDLSKFEKQAVEELKKVENKVAAEVEKAKAEAVSKLVQEVSGKSITCFGWKWSLQITRQTPTPAPAKSEEPASKPTE